MDATELRAWRRAQRSALAVARTALPGAERERASAAIEAHLEAFFAGRRDGVVGVYWPIRDEFDVRPFVATLRARGVTPALPVVVGKDRPLEFRAWMEDEALVAGGFGLAYPASGAGLHPDALVIPLLGFDRDGCRLGYGAGYYDRTLAACSRSRCSSAWASSAAGSRRSIRNRTTCRWMRSSPKPASLEARDELAFERLLPAAAARNLQVDRTHVAIVARVRAARRLTAIDRIERFD